MRHLRIAVALTAIGAALLTPAPASAGARQPGAEGPLGTEQLSDEQTITRWANAATRAVVRTRPTRRARGVTRLRYFTEDGRPEVYVALESRVVAGAPWVRVRVPMRPNGTTGWVKAAALGPLHVVRTQFVVDRAALRATLFRAGRPIWSAPVGVGAPGSPTPAGRFHIRERLRARGGIYGPWAFGTSAYSVRSEWPGGGVVGIHGTNLPGLLPGRVSNGCVRVRNADISRLARLMPIGTPVHIR